MFKVKYYHVYALLYRVNDHQCPLVAVVFPEDERLRHSNAGGLIEVPKAAFLDCKLLLVLAEVYLVLLEDLFRAVEMVMRRVKKCRISFLLSLRNNRVL